MLTAYYCEIGLGESGWVTDEKEDPGKGEKTLAAADVHMNAG